MESNSNALFSPLTCPDVDDVRFVINFDYPSNSEDYIHRIGRTGRKVRKDHRPILTGHALSDSWCQHRGFFLVYFKQKVALVVSPPQCWSRTFWYLRGELGQLVDVSKVERYLIFLL